jgi:carbonic anhydrase
MELHLVFAKIGYEKPLEHNDGITVLAFFYEVADYENVFYQEFTDLLHKIKNVNQSAPFQKPHPLGRLIHTNLQSYFTYNGRYSVSGILNMKIF